MTIQAELERPFVIYNGKQTNKNLSQLTVEFNENERVPTSSLVFEVQSKTHEPT